MTQNSNIVQINDPFQYAGFPDFSDPGNAFFYVIENWDEQKLDNIKEMKSLALGENDKIICELSFVIRPETVLENVKQTLEIAKSHQATKVIMTQNQPWKQAYPNAKEKTLAHKFIACSKEIGIRIEDQLMVSANSCYSFAQNKIN